MPLCRLLLAQDQDAGGQAGAVEQVGCQADDGLEQVHLQQLLPDPAFGTFAEQRAVRQHHGHAAGDVGHRLDHVLHPGEVAADWRRQTGEVAAEGIVGPQFLAPLLQRERRIGDHAVEGGEAVAVEEGRVAQRVAAHDLEILDAVQEQVHPGDGRGGEVLLLPVQLAPQTLHVAMLLFDVLHGGQQHAAGAAGRVVDGLALLGVEHVDHQPHDAARGVELAGLLVGGVGELLDQVLVGVAEQVGLDALVAQRQLGEVLDQVLEQGIRQAVLVGPLGIAEDAVQGVRVGLLDLAHRPLQCRTDVARLGADVVPVAVLWDLEAVRLREPRQLLIASLVDDFLVFLVPDVADALEEQQREDVGLEVSRIHRAAQDVGGLPQVAFKLAQSDIGLP